MAYITHIRVENCRNVKLLDVDLAVPSDEEVRQERPTHTKPAFHHLILTGPNGSGKSGILRAVARCMSNSLILPYEQLNVGLAAFIDKRVFARDGGLGLRGSEQSDYNNLDSDKEKIGKIRLHWKVTGRKDTISTSEPENEGYANSDPRSHRSYLSACFDNGDMIAAYLPARRLLHQQRVPGPSQLSIEKSQLRPGYELAPQFLQFLVNKHTEMTYATVDKDDDDANRIFRWLSNIWSHIRKLVEDPELEIKYDRHSFNFKFKKKSGYEFDLSSLADGHAAVLALLAEVLMRIDAVQQTKKNFSFEPEGIVVVDEIETHLHISLQEQVLRLLIDMFPRIQFIVATHSPAVIASISGAVVYDLGKNTKTPSDDYRGIPYGMLMTEHFGISSDIDLDSTQKLLRLRELLAQPSRTAEEDLEAQDLAAALSARSQVLATEVWMLKEHLGSSNVHLGGERT